MAKRTSYRVYDLPRLAMAKRGNAITHSMIRPEYRRATKRNPHRIYDPPRSNTRQRSNTNTGPTSRTPMQSATRPNFHSVYDPPRSDASQRSNTNTVSTSRTPYSTQQSTIPTGYMLRLAQIPVSGASRPQARQRVPFGNRVTGTKCGVYVPGLVLCQ